MDNVIIANTMLGTDRIAHVSFIDSLLIAIIGIVIVIFVLVLLMYIIQAVGYIMSKGPDYAAKYPKAAAWLDNLRQRFASKKEETANFDIALKATKETAKGVFGELVLHNTTEQEAAMIMAIVAEATETPLNELRFKSIKRVDEGDAK